MRLLGQFYTFFFFTKEHQKASKGTINLKFIDLKFINIRFIDLKFSQFYTFFFYDKISQVQKSIKKHQKAPKSTKKHRKAQLI